MFLDHLNQQLTCVLVVALLHVPRAVPTRPQLLQATVDKRAPIERHPMREGLLHVLIPVLLKTHRSSIPAMLGMLTPIQNPQSKRNQQAPKS